MHPRPHRLSRRSGFLALAAAAALAPALLLALPVAAGAAATNAAGTSSFAVAPAAASCPASTLCAWRDIQFGGTRWTYPYASYPHGVWFFVGSGRNDAISSFYNHRAWTSYYANNCPADADYNWIPGGAQVPDLRFVNFPDNGAANDRTSALGLGLNTGVHTPGHGQC